MLHIGPAVSVHAAHVKTVSSVNKGDFVVAQRIMVLPRRRASPACDRNIVPAPHALWV